MSDKKIETCNHCKKKLKDTYVVKGKKSFCDAECAELYKAPVKKSTTTKKSKSKTSNKKSFGFLDLMSVTMFLGIFGLIGYGVLNG